MLTLTPRATAYVLDASQQSRMAGMPLRVAAQSTPDGELRFGLGFDEQRAEDQVLSFGELTVLVGAPSQALLEDVVLDVVAQEGGESGFVFARREDYPQSGACASGGTPSVHPNPAGCGGACQRCGNGL